MTYLNNKMENLQELEVLSKYLSEEELKEIAKQVAYDKFSRYIGEANSNRKDNYDYFLKHGAIEAVREHMSDFDEKELVDQLKQKTIKLINQLETYHLPDNYKTIAKEHIEANKQLIIDKVNSLMSNFVNSEDYGSAYKTFNEYIGERFSDLLDLLLRKEYQNDSK